MNEPKFKWEIAIAGLIHDIGKLYQKSDSGTVAGVHIRKKSEDHPLMALDFIENHISLFKGVDGLDIEFIKQCSVRHHSGSWGSDDIKVQYAPAQYKRYCEIINIADNISASERASAEDKKAHKELATLVPFFTRLNSSTCFTKYAYKLDRYSKHNFEIIETSEGKHKEDDMDKFISDFEQAVNLLKATTKESLFRELLYVIREYTWCIPAAVREMPRDVSLYQHLVTTSAIATAIYSDLVQCSTDEEFSISSVETKETSIKIVHLKLTGSIEYILNSQKQAFNVLDDISKRREIIETEYQYAVKDIIKSVELTNANKIIDSGFETYILYGEQSEKEIIATINRINTNFKKNFLGDIYISYSIQDLSFNRDNKGYKHMKSLLCDKPTYMINGLEEILKNDAKDSWDEKEFIIKDKDKYIDRSYSNFELSESFHDFKENVKELGNKVAFICVDGDKVADTMEKCFDTISEQSGTISRISTYINVLKNFFDDYIKAKFNETEYVININANRFIIACSTKDAIINASDIRDMFSKYTMGTMTLSISIHVFSINEKFHNIVKLSTNALDKAKRDGGNRIIYKGITLSGSDAERYIDISGLVYESCKNIDSINALRRLAGYSSMYKDYLRTKDLSKLMCHPLYIRNRGKDTVRFDESLIKILDKAFNDIFKGVKTVNKDLYLLEDVISDVLIEKRMEGVR